LLHLPLSGEGPIDIEIEGGATAWVITSDSGNLISVDLSHACETRSFKVGSMLTTLALGFQQAYVGQLDPVAGAQPLVSVDLADGSTVDIRSETMGGLTVLGDYLMALEQSGLMRVIDTPLHNTVSTVVVEVNQNEHMEIVSDGTQAWASGDGTPVQRISLNEREESDVISVAASLDASIETGGGIPFDADGGLVWGARPDEVWAIDPTTNQISKHVALENVIEVLAMDVADGEAWIGARRPGRVGTVIRIDLATGDVLGEWPVSLPAAVKVVGDFAWVASYETDELIGISRSATD